MYRGLDRAPAHFCINLMEKLQMDKKPADIIVRQGELSSTENETLIQNFHWNKTNNRGSNPGSIEVTGSFAITSLGPGFGPIY